MFLFCTKHSNILPKKKKQVQCIRYKGSHEACVSKMLHYVSKL